MPHYTWPNLPNPHWNKQNPRYHQLSPEAQAFWDKATPIRKQIESLQTEAQTKIQAIFDEYNHRIAALEAESEALYQAEQTRMGTP